MRGPMTDKVCRNRESAVSPGYALFVQVPLPMRPALVLDGRELFNQVRAS